MMQVQFLNGSRPRQCFTSKAKTPLSLSLSLSLLLAVPRVCRLPECQSRGARVREL
jgi:hypothetical protein